MNNEQNTVALSIRLRCEYATCVILPIPRYVGYFTPNSASLPESYSVSRKIETYSSCNWRQELLSMCVLPPGKRQTPSLRDYCHSAVSRLAMGGDRGVDKLAGTTRSDYRLYVLHAHQWPYPS